MKINKRVKKYISLGLIVISVIGGIIGYTRHKEKTDAINTVKSQTSNVAEGVTLDEAYSKYIQHLGYTFYKDHEGNEFVQLTGKIYLKNEDRIADLKVTYIVDGDNIKFKDMYLDKMNKTEVDYLILKIKAFSTYDANNL